MTIAGLDEAWPVNFAKVRPGYAVPSWDVTVRESTVARLARGVHEVASDRIPTALAGNLAVGIAFRVLPRNILHTRQQIEVIGTAKVGETLRVATDITTVTNRRGKAYVCFQGSVCHAEGEPLWMTASEFVVPQAPTLGLPEAASESLAWPNDLTDTQDAEQILDLASMAAFAGKGNFHSDREIAQRFGYAAPVAQGMHTAALGFKLVTASGHPWPARGRCDIRFIGTALEDDCLMLQAGRSAGTKRHWLRAQVAGKTIMVACFD